jgi:hypothetical protein
VAEGDEDISCSSDPSNEGFVTLVQGYLSNADSISEGNGMAFEVGDGLDSEEGKNRNQCFD